MVLFSEICSGEIEAVKLSGDAQFSRLVFVGFFVYALAMPIMRRSGKSPIDLRHCLGRQIADIKFKGLRKGGSRWSLWERGRFENRSLLAVRLGVDANGMISSAVLADSAFQPRDLEEVASLCIEFLKKHRLWSPDIELVLDRHRDRIIVKEMAMVHSMVPVEIVAGPEGISITFGKP